MQRLFTKFHESQPFAKYFELECPWS